MSGWHVAHFLVLGAWLGCVLAELLIEAVGTRSEPLGRAAAAIHGAIDRWLELPLVVLVVVTGAMLLRGVEIDAAMGVKIACGLGAAAANAGCAVAVFRRERRAGEGASEAELAALTRWVWLSAAAGVPLGLVALAIGGGRAGWW